MKIVLLEPLAVKDDLIDSLARPFVEAGHSFTAYKDRGDLATQKERVREADVIMLANMPLPAEVINAAANLKFIDVAFTGVDHVDLDAAKAKGAAVSNASGYSTNAVAELSLALMLSLLRNVPQVDKRCREGKTKDGLVGCELRGKTVGIIGFGAIGRKTAELCRAFGAGIMAHSRSLNQQKAGDGVTSSSLEELLQKADLVSLHCPLTPETKGLINRERLAMMKPSAYLINAARGPVVDSQALAEALNNDRLAGAGIDVFEVEPPIETTHPLIGAKNTILTPHVAFATAESLEERAAIVFDSLQKWIDGRQVNIII